jgi:hypothetical protein
MAAQEVLVRLRAVGQRAFQRDMDTSAKSVEGVGKASVTSAKDTAKSFAKWAAGSAAIAGGAKVLKDGVRNAVNLGEEINKTAVVFRGPGAKSVLQWSKSSANALGVSRQQALASAAQFGNMLIPMGFARDKAAAMSKSMVQLGGDMASFNNASPEETLQAIQSGLAGETEPLRRFGVFLSDARVKQQAMNMGLYKGKGNLDAAARAQATYALILKDSKDAQGDFARTSDSLANRQRILKAQYTDITAMLGAKLVPILSFLARNLGLVAAAVGVLVGLWLAYKAAVGIATIAQALFNITLSALPIFAVITGIMLLVGGFVLLYTKVGWFRHAVQATWGWIKSHWPLLLAILTGPFGTAVILIIKNFDRIKKAASDTVHWIADRFRDLINFFKRLPGGVLGKVGGLLGKISPFQHGGTMRPGGGTALVGERGPELLALPGGSRVTPLPGGALAGLTATTAHFYLDRRLVATAVAQADADQRARR